MSVISIIVPVYNVEQYLPACLDSLLAQTYNDIEIICVNDGSMDRSAEIIVQYMQKDSRVRVVEQSNMGVAEARNTGLSEAASPYIMFCDPDDGFKPEMCEKMLAAIQERDADLAACETQVVYLVDEKLKESDEYYFTLKFYSSVMDSSKLFNNIDVCLWNKIFKKSLIDKYEIRFPTGRIYEDVSFIWKCLAVSRICAIVKEKLYLYTRRNGSIMNNTFKNNKRVLDHLLVLDDVYDFLKKYKLINGLKKDFAQSYIVLYWTTKCYLPFTSLPNFFLLHKQLVKKYDNECGMGKYFTELKFRNQWKYMLKSTIKKMIGL